MLDIVRISNHWGTDMLLIQGAGGNISQKEGANLFVKSSGALLKNVTTKDGLTNIDIKKFRSLTPEPRSGIPSAAEEEQYANSILQSQVSAGEKRASMELGFHVAIPHAWVIHLHSIAGILFAQSLQKNKTLASLLQKHKAKIIDIDPALPGTHLTWLIQNKLQGIEAGTTLWLLHGHGVIWSGDNLADIEDTAEEFELCARIEFGLCDLTPPEYISETELSFKHWPRFHFADFPLFPDYAVFFATEELQPKLLERVLQIHPTLVQEKRELVRELLYAHALLSTQGKVLNSLQPLPNFIFQSVAGLATEKARLKQLKKESQ